MPLPPLLRLKARIKSLEFKSRDLRGIAGLHEADGTGKVVAAVVPSELKRFSLYIRAGAQRDHVKVRVRSRAAQLAYAFLRLRPYLMVERSCKSPPHWGQVLALVEEYSEGEPGSEGRSAVLQRFTEWRDSQETELSDAARETLRQRWLEVRESAQQATERTASIKGTGA